MHMQLSVPWIYKHGKRLTPQQTQDVTSVTMCLRIVTTTAFKCININAYDIKDSDIICNLGFIYLFYDIQL